MAFRLLLRLYYNQYYYYYYDGVYYEGSWKKKKYILPIPSILRWIVSIFAQLETHHCPLPKWMAGGIRAVNITKRGDRYILLLLGSQVIQKRAISIQSLFSASKTKTFASISIPPDLTSRSRVRVVGLLLLSLPRRDFFPSSSWIQEKFTDYGLWQMFSFRDARRQSSRFNQNESLSQDALHRCSLRVIFRSGEEEEEEKNKGWKRKRRQQTYTHTPPDEMCRRVFPRDTSLTFSFCFRFVFSWLLLVDDSQIILFNTIKYYERGKRMKNRSLGREQNWDVSLFLSLCHFCFCFLPVLNQRISLH